MRRVLTVVAAAICGALAGTGVVVLALSRRDSGAYFVIEVRLLWSIAAASFLIGGLAGAGWLWMRRAPVD